MEQLAVNCLSCSMVFSPPAKLQSEISHQGSGSSISKSASAALAKMGTPCAKTEEQLWPPEAPGVILITKARMNLFATKALSVLATGRVRLFYLNQFWSEQFFTPREAALTPVGLFWSVTIQHSRFVLKQRYPKLSMLSHNNLSPLYSHCVSVHDIFYPFDTVLKAIQPLPCCWTCFFFFPFFFF